MGIPKRSVEGIPKSLINLGEIDRRGILRAIVALGQLNLDLCDQ